MILIWDPWLRIFHWALVSLVISNQFFNEGNGNWHGPLGYAACALIFWRVVWGFAGPPTARFKSWAQSWPRQGAFLAHCREYLRGKTPRTLTHSPLAAIGMILMLLCVLALGMTGWMMSWDRFFGERWLHQTHDLISYVLVALAIVHLLGVIRASILHRENLIASMIHGKKRAI